MHKWSLITVLFTFLNIHLTNGETYRIAFLCSTSNKGEGKRFGGAFFRALDIINNDTSILPNVTLDYLFHNTKTDTLEAIRAMTSQYRNGTIGFIGPDESCACESTNAAAWNLPMIVYKCHDSTMAEDERETMTKRTFARTQPSTAKVSKSIVSLIQYYKWHRVTLVVGTLAKWNETAQSLIDLCQLNDIRVHETVFFKEPYSASNMRLYDIVHTTHTETRIYIFLGDYHALIDFSRMLKGITGASISDYVVIAMDDRLYDDDPKTYIVKTPFEGEDHLTTDNIRSFGPILLLVPRPPLNNQWESILDDVRERNADDPINGPVPIVAEFFDAKIEVPIYAAYLHDAVTVYARALDDVIRNGSDVNDGVAVISRIRSRTFTSILGYEVYIDKNGDAEGNYTLLTLKFGDNDTGRLAPVGNFLMTNNGVGIPALNLYEEIDWLGGGPPPDAPACGFDGEKCKHELDWRTLTVCVTVAFFVLVASGFGLRHYLYEQKLARLLWKVDYKDITLVDTVEEIIPATRRKHRRSHPWRFLLSYENESERTTLLGDTKERSIGSENGRKVAIGSYKGTIVAVKHVVKKHVEINRTLKKHLQIRKELNHDNINRFIGACVETPHVYILTQYCARGSLEDILGNDDMHLDDMFVSSLVSDLIKAMIFIHDSELVTHGNLKSSNCLVDSRWVLTVSDFGLHQLTNDRCDSFSDVNKYYKRLIWKAPEQLRASNREPTQKGDIYAFALVLYDILSRKGPFGTCSLSYKEIYERVKQGDPVRPLRPDTTALTCESFVKDCVEDCWSEDPEQRPDLKYVRYRLKPMQQGLKANIFDNMIAMMEKYAHNLEELVAERTDLLSQEKQMTENLLLRMLPRFVAEELKQGKPVVPENYDCVSIYFSDIVGFTALSAQSTPLEVVCMLNDLYTCFDSIVENYDVYKIETIGDAYMVVSGLPVRNDDLHAGEIASMSLHLLQAIKCFKMRHRPQDTLKLRIGIHSGPCVAGVVGLKMPRYTLFGDTVNTASRMETTGVPLKIHCSSDIKVILDKLGGYILTERGYVSAKGKGEMLTYFLEGEDASHRKRRISDVKFSRTYSPHSADSDSGDAIFGTSTISPQFWPNGTMNYPGFYTPEAGSPNCDTRTGTGSVKVPSPSCDRRLNRQHSYPTMDNHSPEHRLLPVPPLSCSVEIVKAPNQSQDGSGSGLNAIPTGRKSSLTQLLESNSAMADAITRKAQSRPSEHKPEVIPLLVTNSRKLLNGSIAEDAV